MRKPLTSRAEIRTDAAARYAKQLVAHLGRKLDFTAEGTTATAVIGRAVGRIIAGDDLLTLEAVAGDEAALTQVEDVLGRHLEQFGRRDGLTVTWLRHTPS